MDIEADVLDNREDEGAMRNEKVGGSTCLRSF
jgi:hypothetical protein